MKKGVRGIFQERGKLFNSHSLTCADGKKMNHIPPLKILVFIGIMLFLSGNLFAQIFEQLVPSQKGHTPSSPHFFSVILPA